MVGRLIRRILYEWTPREYSVCSIPFRLSIRIRIRIRIGTETEAPRLITD